MNDAPVEPDHALVHSFGWDSHDVTFRIATSKSAARATATRPRERAMRMKAYASFDAYLADQSARNKPIIRALREFVNRVAPGLRESVKWGNGCWLGEKDPVVYVYSAPDYVQFGFFRGSALADPRGLLEGAGAYVRHIKVRDRAAIDERAFAALVKQAVRADAAAARAKAAKSGGAPAKKPAAAGAKANSTATATTRARGSTKAAKSATARNPARASGTKPTLLSGGNPQIAKADGDAPVQAYIAAMPGWKRDVGRRLDALITRAAPRARKAVRWNSPFYGIEGRGWFLAMHVFTHYVKVTFFFGASLSPVPPGGTQKDARWIDIREGELDQARAAQIAKWVKQAAARPGWGKS